MHLTRHAGTSHTVTVDATRPWIVYNNSSQFAAMPWVDVLDIRSCLGPDGLPLEAKRAKCRPKVYRIEFEPEWTQQRDWDPASWRPGAPRRATTSRPHRASSTARGSTRHWSSTSAT